MIVPILALAAVLQDTQTMPVDPAFKDLGRLVGGVWRSKAGKITIEHRYHFEVNHTVIVDQGEVKQGAAVILEIAARYGWDPVAKKTYYLDAHNNDEVFFGHVTSVEKGVSIDFSSLIHPENHLGSDLIFDGPDDATFAVVDKLEGGKTKVLLAGKLHREQE